MIPPTLQGVGWVVALKSCPVPLWAHRLTLSLLISMQKHISPLKSKFPSLLNIAMLLAPEVSSMASEVKLLL